MLKRILPVIVTVSILLCCVIVSASAVGVDYTDYIVDVFETDGVDMVRVSIPTSEFGPGGWYITDLTTGVQTHSVGHSFTWDYLADHEYRMAYYPFQGTDGLDATDIPDGTAMTISVYGDTSGFDGYSTPRHRWTMIYRNGSTNLGSAMSDQSSHGFVDDENWKAFTIEKPIGTNLLYFYCDFLDFALLGGFEDVTATVGVSSVDMIMTIDSLMLQQIQTGKTNKILSSVEQHLAEQGKTLKDVLNHQEQINDKLDDIINGEVNGTPPEGSDIVDDYQSAEDQLMDSVEGGSSEFDDVSMTAWDRLYTYQQSFLAFSSLFNLFADIPFFQSLLYISLTLGSVVFLLGIGAAAARYEERHHTVAGQRRRRA